MTIKEAQIKVDNWIKKYGVRYFDEMTNMALLVEEVGEVARIMARTYGEQSAKPSDMSKKLSEELKIIGVPYLIVNGKSNPGALIGDKFEQMVIESNQ